MLVMSDGAMKSLDTFVIRLWARLNDDDVLEIVVIDQELLRYALVTKCGFDGSFQNC